MVVQEALRRLERLISNRNIVSKGGEEEDEKKEQEGEDAPESSVLSEIEKFRQQQAERDKVKEEERKRELRRKLEERERLEKETVRIRPSVSCVMSRRAHQVGRHVAG